MEIVTVKILKDNRETGSREITSPITAAEAQAHLTNINREWRGWLTEPGSGIGIPGNHELTPGLTYFLHLQEPAGEHCNTATTDACVYTKHNSSLTLNT